MLRHYLLVAIRMLAKEKIYVFINVFSLAFGVGSFIIFQLYLKSELSYDRHYSKHENIYRVSSLFDDAGGGQSHFAINAAGLGPLLIQDNPDMGEQVRVRSSSQNVLNHQDKSFSWDSIFMVDENYFDIFDHEILAGDPQTAFSDIYSIAVSESFARSYFGDEDPIGKTVENDDFTFRITLLFADQPENTHLKFDVLYPYRFFGAFVPNYEENYISGLFGSNTYTYLHLNPNFNIGNFPKVIEDFMDKYLDGDGFGVELTSLDSVHYEQGLIGDRPSGNILYLYGFSAVAIFILLVACINYINLATARATKRSKEVAMRKILGAKRGQLVGQFMGESFVFTFLAMIIGLALAVSALAFSSIGLLLGKETLLNDLASFSGALSVFGLGVSVAILSGLYPAFYLSSISPLAAMGSAPRAWYRGPSLRQSLVLIQISISIGVIACTLLMTQQMQYIANKPLGLSTKNQLWVNLRGAAAIEAIPALRNELIANASINQVVDMELLPQFGTYINPVSLQDNNGALVRDTIDFMRVGLNYVEAMGIDLTRGRTFAEDNSVDPTSTVIVNETLARRMGWDEPIGKQITLGGETQVTVIGVTADFHYASLQNAIGALVMRPLNSNFENLSATRRALLQRNLLINIEGENVLDTFNSIEAIVRRFDPSHRFEPKFLDTELRALYKPETNLTNLIELFAGICVLISTMGLFGLASFNTQLRYREIAIRKVLGANAFQVVSMLSKNFLIMLFIASLPATAISYFTISKWLERFAYRAEPDLIAAMAPYAIAIVAVSFVALIIVSAQSLKTAQSNPVEALRYQ